MIYFFLYNKLFKSFIYLNIISLIINLFDDKAFLVFIENSAFRLFIPAKHLLFNF